VQAARHGRPAARRVTAPGSTINPVSEPRYSFVVPIYNEQETLPELGRRLTAVMNGLDGDAEAIFVDDGSTDASPSLVLELRDRDDRFKLVRFSRNFGHQVAITAGLDFASGDAVVIMDGDLQDPPELVPDLVARWREGYEVVYAVRADRRDSESLPKRLATRLAYRVLRRLTHVDLPVDVGDFRLVDRRAVDEFRRLREHNRYVRGLFAWVGFRQIGVPYRRDPRHAGKTKYSWGKLGKLASDGVMGFSDVPLRLALGFGFLFSGLSFLYGISAIVKRLLGIGYVPGWASAVALPAFIGGVQLIIIGVMGIYVGRIYEEVKQRPLYVVRDLRGLDPAERPVEAPVLHGFDE
jgi:glycosyltransferase involved in cell wall biosynthesis